MKQFRNGLALFTKNSGRRSYNIASFHPPRSLTWRWVLYLDLPRSEHRWLSFHRPRWGGQEKWSLYLFKFRLGWMTQEPMWR